MSATKPTPSNPARATYLAEVRRIQAEIQALRVGGFTAAEVEIVRQLGIEMIAAAEAFAASQ